VAADRTRTRPALPLLLSINGGLVDTMSYLALQGLFAAHVTGNFVTLGASIVFGTSGILPKILALPTFCVVIVATRWVSYPLASRRSPVLRAMLSLKVLLLFLAAGLAIRYGPFASGDSAAALATGLLLVSAMAIQNAAHRIHMGSSPPTTLVTGSTTQIMIDLADLARNPPAMTEEARKAAHTRFKRLGSSVAAFAIGCAAGAILYVTLGTWCFLVPAGLGVIPLLLRLAAYPSDLE
jgi:uncharacterized membrane protein YoaK (UPF0700 family)